MDEQKKSKNKEGFLIDFIGFYNDFLCGTSKAIKKLSKIQSNYKDDYKYLKEIQRNPDALLKILNNLEDKQKLILYEIFTKSASLSNRTRILFELNDKEQEQLADDLEKFSKELIEKIKLVKK